MAKLIYTYLTSLDGYVADGAGSFDWAVPDEEVLRHINDVERGVGTHLYGRTMYELMIGWETDPAAAAQSPMSAEFARIWQDADKVVFSRTLTSVPTRRTRLAPEFDVELVEELKRSADGDLSVSGADLAASAWRAGLVDECRLYVAPILVGDGKRMFPAGVRRPLELLDQRRFGNGMTYLRYAVRPGDGPPDHDHPHIAAG